MSVSIENWTKNLMSYRKMKLKWEAKYVESNNQENVNL